MCKIYKIYLNLILLFRSLSRFTFPITIPYLDIGTFLLVWHCASNFLFMLFFIRTSLLLKFLILLLFPGLFMHRLSLSLLMNHSGLNKSPCGSTSLIWCMIIGYKWKDKFKIWVWKKERNKLCYSFHFDFTTQHT